MLKAITKKFLPEIKSSIKWICKNSDLLDSYYELSEDLYRADNEIVKMGSVTRQNMDAVAVILYDYEKNTYPTPSNLRIWLRSCLRPASAKRYAEDEKYKFDGRFWELPAGLIEKDEAPAAAAIREVKEETGFIIERDKIEYINVAVSNPGTLAEQVFLYKTDVTNCKREFMQPDGPLEANGQVSPLYIKDALEAIHNREISDMKTLMAIYYLLWAMPEKKFPKAQAAIG